MIKRLLVIFFISEIVFQHCALGQPQKPLPDPMAAPPTRSTFGLPDPLAPIPISTTPGKPALPSSEVARAMAEKITSAINQLTQKIADNEAELVKMDNKVRELNSELNNLNSEMNKILNDFRTGMFCNECNRSMTELGGSQAFWAHIAENAANGRRAIPASPEKIAQKKKEFTDKVAMKEKERDRVASERTEKVAENKEAWEQIQQGCNLWQIATKFETTLIQAHEEETRQREQRAIQQAQEKLNAVHAARMRLAGRELQSELSNQLLTEEKLWSHILNKAQSNANNRISSYYQDLQTATEYRNKEYGQMARGFQRTDPFKQRMSNALDLLPPFNLHLSSVPVVNRIPIANAFSFDYQGRSLGMYFKFGSLNKFAKLSAGYEAKGDEISLEAKTFLDLYTVFGSIRVGVGMKTTYGPDRTTTENTYQFDVKGPEKKPAPKKP
jgi:hypothetical protein